MGSIVKTTTPAPTTLPSAVPSVKPTSLPTTPAPTNVPTLAPTQMPSTGFALTDITALTTTAQTMWYRSKYVGVVYTFKDCTYNFAEDAARQADYPTSQIVTIIDSDALPIKFAMLKEHRAPTPTPTLRPTTSSPTAPRVWRHYGNFILNNPQIYPPYDAVSAASRAFSCAEACAFVFGPRTVEDLANWRCSTTSSSMTYTGYYTQVGVSGCQLLADTTKNCDGYNAAGCYSALAPDNCHGAYNYCWRLS